MLVELSQVGTVVVLELGHLRLKVFADKPSGATANFPLENNLFRNVTGITEIKLPAEVYDSYTATERSAIFGTIPLTPVP